MKNRIAETLFAVIGCLVLLFAGACNTATVSPSLTPSPVPEETATPLPPLPTLADSPAPQVTIFQSGDVEATMTAVAQQPTTAVQRVVCAGAPPTRLIVNERGRVTIKPDRSVEADSLNLRAGPGTEYRILRKINPGELFFVLGGPECGGDFVWYRVSAGGVTGWIAEGDENEYYVEPYLPG